MFQPARLRYLVFRSRKDGIETVRLLRFSSVLAEQRVIADDLVGNAHGALHPRIDPATYAEER